MIPVEPPPTRCIFPSALTGRGREGIVCVGGDFQAGTLLAAYRSGLFPWPLSSDVVPWCSPNPRAIFPLDAPEPWSRSLRRTLRKAPFRITADTAFPDVIERCGDRSEGTWITPALTEGYCTLHRLGWAHSVEVWNPAGELVGGIYGLAIGAMFAGESMFHRETDASKVAFVHLVRRLVASGFRLFDVQVLNPHLESLGCMAIPRAEYLRRLEEAIALPRTF